MSLWKGCSFPDNTLEEQKDWEAAVGRFLPSALAVTLIRVACSPPAHLGMALLTEQWRAAV